MNAVDTFLRYVEFEGIDSVVITKSSMISVDRKYMFCNRDCAECVNKNVYETSNRCMLTYEEVLEIKEDYPEYFI